jgi:hypothetical protein
MRTKFGGVMLPLVGLMVVLGCGDDGGGGSGGGTGETPDPFPDENGGQCGHDIYGWETRCMVQDVIADASDRGQVPGAPAEGDQTAGRLCCEGNPPVATADAGCSDICLRELCEAAKVDHMSRCESCGLYDCGFDMSNCLAGGAHKQFVTCLALQLPYSYTLTASCSAYNNEDRNPDGSFGFLEQPVNIDTTNDPEICNPPSNLEHDPPRGLGQYKGSESDGTVARVTWTMAGAGGEEQSEDLAVDFQYAMLPCAASPDECIQLTALDLTLPTTEVLGMTLTHARLSVISVTEAPRMERDGRFHFSDGSLRVLMQAYVNGFPLLLSGWNAGEARGRVSPAGDQLSLIDLRFELEDSVIAAALEISIMGHYDARRPNAQITQVGAPAGCDEPVTLLATSWDDDLEPLTHRWWIRDVGTFEGPAIEVVLAAGEHDVMLTSFDPSGLFDSEALRYARRCR